MLRLWREALLVSVVQTLGIERLCRRQRRQAPGYLRGQSKAQLWLSNEESERKWVHGGKITLIRLYITWPVVVP